MTESILQLKVTLRETRPPIWRRLLVRSDITLAQLHQVLQAAMGWTDSHLHQFVKRGVLFGPPNPEFGLARRNEKRVRVGEILARPKDRLRYEYDFGDGWEHDVVVEAVSPAFPAGRYPWVLAGRRACPPEDCGGAPGYHALLEALADPRHPEHGPIAEWLGRPFDPEEFDLDEVNRLFHGA